MSYGPYNYFDPDRPLKRDEAPEWLRQLADSMHVPEGVHEVRVYRSLNLETDGVKYAFTWWKGKERFKAIFEMPPTTPEEMKTALWTQMRMGI